MGTPTVVDVPLFSGKVVRFDEGRGYGFIAPDGGGDDVFLHVNDLPSDSDQIICGTSVKFRVIDGGRGPKAYDVRLFDNRNASGPAAPAAPPVKPSSTVAAAGSGGAADEADVICDVLSEQEFLAEVTELILASDTAVNAGQVLALREALRTFAHSHGWLD